LRETCHPLAGAFSGVGAKNFMTTKRRLYLVDADFRIREVNPTTAKVLGVIPNLIGRDFAEVIAILCKDYAEDLVRVFRPTENRRTLLYRLRFGGPEIRLWPKAALALSMALHELATMPSSTGHFQMPTAL
jgi:PAS domain-containing protein